MLDISAIQKAIHEEKLDGWLFCSVYNRDPLFRAILGTGEDFKPSRPCAYLIPASGIPIKITSLVEPNLLDHLQGKTISYNGRNQWEEAFCSISRGHYAVQNSATIPFLSGLEASTSSFLRRLGWELVPSENLVQKTAGFLNKEQISSHKKAADKLYAIVREVWDRLSNKYQNSFLFETDILTCILDLMEDYSLETCTPPIVGFGKNTSVPHYSPEGKGNQLLANQVIQLDLWAKEKKPGAIYADIAWIGYSGSEIPKEIEDIFTHVITARDEAVNFIQRCLRCNKTLTGAMIDQDVRRYFETNNLLQFTKHRTGHSIDNEVHGIGVNLDCFEFADTRPIIEGCCFSIEPGLYKNEFGMRSEINVCISKNEPVITGGVTQKKIISMETQSIT